jgi:hypothetical protein
MGVVVSTDSTDDGAQEPGADVSPRRESQTGRYTRSSGGMIGALLVTLLVIGAFVVVRALNRNDLEVTPQKLEYLAQVGYAQESGSKPVYPARLPSGWYATTMTFSAAGTSPDVELSMLTADGRYVGFVESPRTVPELLTTYVDPHPRFGTSVSVSGSVASRWSTWTDADGDTALVAQRGTGKALESLMVFGTVSRSQLVQLAGSLTTAPIPK